MFFSTFDSKGESLQTFGGVAWECGSSGKSVHTMECRTKSPSPAREEVCTWPQDTPVVEVRIALHQMQHGILIICASINCIGITHLILIPTFLYSVNYLCFSQSVYVCFRSGQLLYSFYSNLFGPCENPVLRRLTYVYWFSKCFFFERLHYKFEVFIAFLCIGFIGFSATFFTLPFCRFFLACV